MRRSSDRQQPRHVVVLGAGLAGLLAAAAAAGDGRTVTVLERDVLPEVPEPRSGVPQGRHPHVFLYRGLLAVEELLPGFSAELRAAGAVPFDTGDLAWHWEPGWAPTGRPHFEVLSATRPLFEHLVRRRVQALPGVEVRDDTQVEALRRGPPGGQPWSVQTSTGSTVGADLVIEACGRRSRFRSWLAALDVPPVATSELDARIGYASRLYDLRRGQLLVPGVVVLQNPGTGIGGMVLPMEGGRVMVSATGAGRRRPGRDVQDLLDHLDALPDGALAAVARGARPVTDVAVHRQTGNRRHHYELVQDWPAGLLVVGDALCAFNPVYGQGVTVAACEALLLRRALDRGLREGDERRLLRGFCRIAALPWRITTGEDARYPSSSAGATWAQSPFARWARELSRLAAHRNHLAHTSVARVYHLMASPLLLLRPDLVAAVLRARLRGYGRATPRPAIVEGDTEPR